SKALVYCVHHTVIALAGPRKLRTFKRTQYGNGIISRPTVHDQNFYGSVILIQAGPKRLLDIAALIEAWHYDRHQRTARMHYRRRGRAYKLVQVWRLIAKPPSLVGLALFS